MTMFMLCVLGYKLSFKEDSHERSQYVLNTNTIFFNILDPPLVKFMEAEPMGVKGG